MISSLKGKRPEEEEEYDADAAERARKIQEEIRRKILERQRESAGPTAEPPRSLVFDEPEEVEAIPERPVAVPRRQEPAVEAVEEVPYGQADPFEKRRLEIEQKLEEAKKAHQLAKEKAGSIAKARWQVPISESSVSGGQIRHRVKRSLGDRGSLKTAIVLREVLDTPVGMR
ncbi:hypothetical protein [Pelagicoccus sp. SDUM812005]|uniref:hypothetical protein n=1 Tax=Pelagicoccus sp. SDUM812005 TaxID=3041257 RepID=UPI00280E2B71|nr:hypothetical protein [Pelagicoccus sp. SDUM812005]MDQ8181846.1 hypothetical protein [Pelagicoccus sp. SDUM812005]